MLLKTIEGVKSSGILSDWNGSRRTWGCTFQLGQGPPRSRGVGGGGMSGRWASYCSPSKRCPPGPFPFLELINPAHGSHWDGLLPVPITGLTPTNISSVIPTLPFHAPLSRPIHPFAHKRSAVIHCLFVSCSEFIYSFQGIEFLLRDGNRPALDPALGMARAAHLVLQLWVPLLGRTEALNQ